ncbi:hypothetical protein C8R42DRAFT_646362 [Lentinula raphanica]|nr:hypothetical protein C8R42DRAFT_646362 [Lentinula raphanica]
MSTGWAEDLHSEFPELLPEQNPPPTMAKHGINTWFIGFSRLIDVVIALHARGKLDIEMMNAASKACSECWSAAGAWKGLEESREEHDATPTTFHDHATPTAFRNDATPTAFRDDATPTTFCDDATPTAFHDDAMPTAFHNNAMPTAFHNDATSTAFHEVPPPRTRTSASSMEIRGLFFLSKTLNGQTKMQKDKQMTMDKWMKSNEYNLRKPRNNNNTTTKQSTRADASKTPAPSTRRQPTSVAVKKRKVWQNEEPMLTTLLPKINPGPLVLQLERHPLKKLETDAPARKKQKSTRKDPEEEIHQQELHISKITLSLETPGTPPKS